MKTKTIFGILDRVAESIDKVGQARVAAAVVLKNDIVSIGFNRRKSHPMQKKYSSHEDAIFMHAEIDAIRGALRNVSVEDLSRSTLYVSRLKFANSESNLSKERMHRGLAKPCSGCTSAIAAFDIKHVCFSTETDVEWISRDSGYQ